MVRRRSHGPGRPAGILLAAVLLGAWLRPFPSGAAPADIGRPVPLPAHECETVLVRWLSDNGYEVSRNGTPDGGARLVARRGSESWALIVVPYSPLGSRVRAELTREGKADPSGPADVRDRIARYLRGNGRDGGPGGLPPVPPAVRERTAAAVCLSAPERGGDPIRFSGIVVDGRGLVVSTAHDLEGVDVVTVRFAAGGEAPGRLVRRDAGRDLSLIRFRERATTSVSLSGARDVLEPGESVFSIGCPGAAGPAIRAGIVSGPPRKANGEPLWPVEMETLPGSSGGPVFDGAGSFVGVVKGRYRGTASQGFVIPARTIAEFLREAQGP